MSSCPPYNPRATASSNVVTRSASPLVDQVRHQSGPAGLVVRAETGAVVAVEIFVEQQQVAPVLVVLELLRAAVDRTRAVLAAGEQADHPVGHVAPHLFGGQRLAVL